MNTRKGKEMYLSQDLFYHEQNICNTKRRLIFFSSWKWKIIIFGNHELLARDFVPIRLFVLRSDVAVNWAARRIKSQSMRSNGISAFIGKRQDTTTPYACTDKLDCRMQCENKSFINVSLKNTLGKKNQIFWMTAIAMIFTHIILA